MRACRAPVPVRRRPPRRASARRLIRAPRQALREAFRREAIRIGDQGEALGSEQRRQHIGHQRPKPSFVKHIRAEDYGKLLGRKVAPIKPAGRDLSRIDSIGAALRRTKSSGASS